MLPSTGEDYSPDGSTDYFGALDDPHMMHQATNAR